MKMSNIREKLIGWIKRLLGIQSPSPNKKRHRAYAHIDQNIEKRWEQEEKL